MEQPTDGNLNPQREEMTIERVLQILREGEFETEHGMMRWSSNYTFMVSLKHGETTLTAVYKPQKGERPLWDFQEGTLCQREVAAFLTAQELGWLLVPPTVLREGPRGIGSLQVYIDHNPDENYFTFDETMAEPLRHLAAFDCIVNNADRKGGHCLVDERHRLWGIDHGITFHKQHKLRTVIWDFAGKPIPDHLLTDIERLCAALENAESSYHQELKKLLDADEIAACQRRVRRLLEQKTYPKPGPGPNYPWPPV